VIAGLNDMCWIIQSMATQYRMDAKTQPCLTPEVVESLGDSFCPIQVAQNRACLATSCLAFSCPAILCPAISCPSFSTPPSTHDKPRWTRLLWYRSNCHINDYLCAIKTVTHVKRVVFLTHLSDLKFIGIIMQISKIINKTRRRLQMRSVWRQ